MVKEGLHARAELLLGGRGGGDGGVERRVELWGAADESVDVRDVRLLLQPGPVGLRAGERVQEEDQQEGQEWQPPKIRDLLRS